MKHVLFIVILSILCISQLSAQKVTFHVTAEKVNPEEQVYITGNLPQLGAWSPNKVPLIKMNSKEYSVTIQIAKGTAVECKITKGSWDKEAVFSKGKIPGNITFTVNADTTVALTVPGWKDEEDFPRFKGGITGEVHYLRGVTYPGLKDRDVAVWLPKGYHTSDARYPVLYMHDGQNIFDPATASFGVDWQADECADSLIAKKTIPPVIIVAVNNTADRTEEYSDCEKGHLYMRFITSVLKPKIDSIYRTKPERQFTATIGSSMGGLEAFLLAWYYNDVFSAAGCFSPAFKIDVFDAVSMAKEYTGLKKEMKLYIDNGGKGVDVLLQPGITMMEDVLLMRGYRKDADFTIIIQPEADHSEADWAKRLPGALQFLYGN